MKVAINSLIELPFVSKELELLTNRAIIDPSSIEYSRDIQTITIPMKRQKIINYKKRLFSIKPIYGREYINSVLIVKKVGECNIIDRCENTISNITLLFGVQIRGKDICISSAEETLGNTSYELILKVNELDIDFYDLG